MQAGEALARSDVEAPSCRRTGAVERVSASCLSGSNEVLFLRPLWLKDKDTADMNSPNFDQRLFKLQSTGKQLEACGILMFGLNWRAVLSKQLNVSRSTLGRWVNGKGNQVPLEKLELVRRMMRAQAIHLLRISEELGPIGG